MKKAFAIPFILLMCSAAYAQEVTITSKPAGAMVMINGQYAGLAPVKKQLEAGDYRLHLKRKGYHDLNLDISVPLEDPVVTAELKAVEKGSLHITSDPEECSVNINGQPAGTTPLTIKNLSDDVYQIRIQKPNYSTFMKSVEITQGEDVTLHAELVSLMEEYYLQEIEENPDDLMKYTELGHYYLLQGDWDKAAEVFKKGVEAAADMNRRNQGLMRFYQELAKAYTLQFNFCERSELDKFRKSFADVIEYAIEKGPSTIRHYRQIASLYIGTAPEATVQALVERMHKADPNRNVYKEFGDIYLQRGITDRAIKMYKQALEVKDDFSTRYSLATAYHRRGNFVKALEEYKTCKEMDAAANSKNELYYQMARLYYENGNAEEALRYINLSTQNRADDNHILLKINILLELNKKDEARDLAKKLARDSKSYKTRRAAKFMLDGALKVSEEKQAPQK